VTANAIDKLRFAVGDEAAEQPTCQYGGLPPQVPRSATTSSLRPG